MVIKRFDVYLVNLDPTIGKEIQKTRPCVIISPDEMNKYIRTVIIAPRKTKGQYYPTQAKCQFEGKDGEVVLDQIRAVDKTRLVKKLGVISANTQKKWYPYYSKCLLPHNFH